MLFRSPLPTRRLLSTLLSRRFTSALQQQQQQQQPPSQSQSQPQPVKKVHRSRRALFYVPASDEKKIKKATTLAADCICLDLEDGVATNRKQEAREEIVRFLTNDRSAFGSSEVLVRINAIRSGFEHQDLLSLEPVLQQIDGILIPKVESPDDVNLVANYLEKKGRKDGSEPQVIIAQIESAKALVELRQICSNSSPRLDALVYSSEDICADIGMTRTPSAKELLYSRSRVVTFAAAYELQPIDMVCVNYKDLDQLRLECKEGSQMGYHGKQAIHPIQLSVIYESFRPPPHLVSLAQRIVEANRIHQEKGQGAFSLDGLMIDLPMVKWAQNLLRKI